MVVDEALWRPDYFVVHLDVSPFIVFVAFGVPACVISVWGLDGIPFVFV